MRQFQLQSLHSTAPAFVDCLFGGEVEDQLDVVFVQAPPQSGKTTMSKLVYDRLQEMNIPVTLLGRDLRFASDSRYHNILEDYKVMHGTRVLLLDDAQETCGDGLLWDVFVKNTLGGKYPGLKLIIFWGYGNFHDLCTQEQAVPISLWAKCVLGLLPKVSRGWNGENLHRPGLLLSRSDRDKLVDHGGYGVAREFIWNPSLGHAGIARCAVEFLRPRTPADYSRLADVEEMFQDDAFLACAAGYCGMPTVANFQRVMDNIQILQQDVLQAATILNDVAAGRSVNDVKDNRVLGILTRTGFLFQTATSEPEFASPTHRRVWLRSFRQDPLTYLMNNSSRHAFVVKCVRRMSSACLASAAIEVLEKYIQQELYQTTDSCLPWKYDVYPLYGRYGGQPVFDLEIRGKSVLWIWGVRFNGRGRPDGSVRNGKYRKTPTHLFTRTTIMIRATTR